MPEISLRAIKWARIKHGTKIPLFDEKRITKTHVLNATKAQNPAGYKSMRQKIRKKTTLR